MFRKGPLRWLTSSKWDRTVLCNFCDLFISRLCHLPAAPRGGLVWPCAAHADLTPGPDGGDARGGRVQSPCARSTCTRPSRPGLTGPGPPPPSPARLGRRRSCAFPAARRPAPARGTHAGFFTSRSRSAARRRAVPGRAPPPPSGPASLRRRTQLPSGSSVSA